MQGAIYDRIDIDIRADAAIPGQQERETDDASKNRLPVSRGVLILLIAHT